MSEKLTFKRLGAGVYVGTANGHRYVAVLHAQWWYVRVDDLPLRTEPFYSLNDAKRAAKRHAEGAGQ